MSDTPLVSVVIPTYNQPLLRQTLDSVLAQTFTDFEIVIINDGCTDDTLKQLEPLVGSHAGKIRIITQTNRGIGAARNCGIDEARGKYIALLDHDDLWLPGKLAAQVTLFERHPEIVACNVPFAFSYAPKVSAFDPDALGAVDGVISRPLRAAGEGHNFTLTSVLMFDREKARGLRHGEERGVVEDMQFQIGLLSRGPFGIAGREILAIYRVHESNFSNRAQFYVGGIQLLRKMDASGAFKDVAPDQRDDLLKYIAGMGRMAVIKDITTGNRRRAMKTYIEEFGHQLRGGRYRFVMTAPLLALFPAKWVSALSRRGAPKPTEGQ